MTASCMMPIIFPVTAHTQHVGPGSIFVAIAGFSQDGATYIPEALHKGAKTIVIQKDVQLSTDTLNAIQYHNAILVCVTNTRYALAELSAQAAGYPANQLKIIGITGTKGKTTSAYLLTHILQESGIKTARITGVKNSINGHEMPASLTTPQPDYLHQFFKLCVEQEVTHVVMEVAAQALSLDRVATVIFDGIIFTNIAREHFEMYATMDDYFATKMRIFNHITPTSYCLANADDSYGATIPNTISQVCTYGFGNNANIMAVEHRVGKGISIEINNETYYCPSLIGHFNAQNVLGVVLMARRYGLTTQQINATLATFGSIPGRMERYTLSNGATCIIDYAHNPSSYEAFLSTLRPFTNHLIVLFGASGTRDKGKRPLMGTVAAQYADCIILTADNPGPEDPLLIIEDIAKGIDAIHQHKIIKEPDRKQAIHMAYKHAQAGSMIVLLGKGPDEYQVIKGVRHYFSEREIIQKL
ncbi:MAG TPA: UDP-N-acetylmuramoyl-L-alanyl-D-glutamate--2,6-diaminopimelate ligase [Candidatus Babeliales bacterium]|jgi:UDP-N-acetylmuramoyl-L-alanyl-D-glutamate--2,6-diaminopimelate ligase|nr:UDP-N-acetylmuramoyl-L-alanyl-D-glutamate--2,6-diaminopimelate ligase [Candidatus Babeliales bacterium]